MGLFNRNKKQELKAANKPADSRSTFGKQSFSTPFLKIGKGDLTKPFISDDYIGHSGFVRFGSDNLFPQVLNQLYYTSPLHGGIIEFKKNAITGGGFEIQNGDADVKAQTDLKYFIKRNKLKKIVPQITRDFIIHNQIFFIVHVDPDTGKKLKVERVDPEKVRLDAAKQVGFISRDWSKQLGIYQIPVYKEGSRKPKQLFVYQDEGPGQDIYSLPMTISANNWIFLDGEASNLHKSNIQESIFPSMIVKRPKRFNNQEEADDFKEALTRKKGADDAGFVWVLTADNKEMMPEIDTVQTSGNDNLMMQTDERMDSRICQAHQIDPMIMGIRVSGKLGSGLELPQAVAAFEKNYVAPVREIIEDIFNDLMMMFEIKGDFVLADYQIVDGEIQDKTDDVDAEIDSVDGVELEVNDNLRGLSASENADIYRIVRDFERGKLNKAVAKTRLLAYGIGADAAEEILKLD